MENQGISGLLNHGVYLLGIPTFLGALFEFVEQHSQGVVGCGIIATYLTSLLFQLLNYRLRVRELDRSASYELALKYSRHQEPEPD
jgi:hypothetical protein